jgi:hypothetical protein
MMDVLYGVRMAGPLAPYARGLAGELARLGFTELSARGQLGLAAHLSRWLEAAGMGTAELAGTTVEAYLAARRASGYTASACTASTSWHGLATRSCGPSASS